MCWGGGIIVLGRCIPQSVVVELWCCARLIGNCVPCIPSGSEWVVNLPRRFSETAGTCTQFQWVCLLKTSTGSRQDGLQRVQRHFFLHIKSVYSKGAVNLVFKPVNRQWRGGRAGLWDCLGVSEHLLNLNVQGVPSGRVEVGA